MTRAVKGIPEGSSVVIPRLYCRDVAAEIDFCRNTFGAIELGRRPGPDGAAAHALMTIGPAMIMIEAEWPGFASRAPTPDGSSPVVIFVRIVLFSALSQIPLRLLYAFFMPSSGPLA